MYKHQNELTHLKELFFSNRHELLELEITTVDGVLKEDVIIHKGVEMPERSKFVKKQDKKKRDNFMHYPWKKMEVGDCFYIICDSHEQHIETDRRMKCLCSKKRAAAKEDKTFEDFKHIKFIDAKGILKVGLWRIK